MKIVFAYARVSTTDQNLQRQIDAIHKYVPDMPEQNFFMDEISGKTEGTDRPQYHALKIILSNLSDINRQKEHPDEIDLVVEELDRLGRTRMIIKDEMEWFRKHGIKLRILEIPTTLTEVDQQNGWVLDLVTNILIEVYTSIAEQELDKKQKRQKEGIAVAKRLGRYKGRKPIHVDSELFKTVYKRVQKKEITNLQAMDILDLKNNTYYSCVHQLGDGTLEAYRK
jgi:DNA invertase Pin-like site-specific DNA recombinase